MTPSSTPFAVGLHRPVYLWAGPSSVRMNRLKFMGAAVDEQVQLEAHTSVGASRMAREAGFNWAYLMYNWGFPPEIEREDWESFRRAVPLYQAAGLQVFGYVQSSNCVCAGSFRDKDWYALGPRGRRFHYYTGRYMICWSHPEWLNHLRGMVRGVIEAGADGVFFDNPWHGTIPTHLGGVWIGSAGCYCPRCRAAFRKASGQEIPARIDPANDPRAREYLRWRAGQVTQTLRMLADHARSLNPNVVISANDFDPVMVPSFLVHGIDLAALARVQDVVMIEDYCLARWEAGGPRLVNNALTLRTARALLGGTALSTIPYDKGIGFDAVYPARRFRQAMAEAAACGAVTVVKGTEYVEAGIFTLLTAERYRPQREAIGGYHRWLIEHAGLYVDRKNAAAVGLLHPGDALWQRWGQLAALYFGAAQTLLAAGVPWRVVTEGDDLSGLEVLLNFGPLQARTEVGGGPEREGTHLVDVSVLPGWKAPASGLLARYGALRCIVEAGGRWFHRAYFERRWARRLADWLRVPQRLLQSSHFRLPPMAARRALLAALGPTSCPHVTAEIPVLAEHWRRGDSEQLHLVNYAERPQAVTVAFGRPVKGRSFSPDAASTDFQGEGLDLTLDVYTVLEYRGEAAVREGKG